MSLICKIELDKFLYTHVGLVESVFLYVCRRIASSHNNILFVGKENRDLRGIIKENDCVMLLNSLSLDISPTNSHLVSGMK